jgi:hypothetical protein
MSGDSPPDPGAWRSVMAKYDFMLAEWEPDVPGVTRLAWATLEECYGEKLEKDLEKDPLILPCASHILSILRRVSEKTESQVRTGIE